MISPISSFSALSSNSQIIASTSDASPVQQVQRVARRPVQGDIELPNLYQQGDKTKPQDRVTLLGENGVESGKAYGLEANELRKQGLKNQLSTNSGVELEIMGEEAPEEGIQNGVGQTTDSEESSESTENVSDEKKSADSQQELTEEEKQEVEKLKQRDTEVRTHEQAHLSAAGSLAQGGASYEYQTGPDGKKYAVGGEVSIDTSPGSTPEETIAKMQKVRAAALAPAEPSGQDRAVAASAMQQLTKAQQEMHAQPAEDEEAVESADNEGVNIESKVENSKSNVENEEPVTVEKIQEEAVEEATSGETNTKTAEAGMVEMPMTPAAENNPASNRNSNSVPQAKLTFQQHAARTAYGIPA